MNYDVELIRQLQISLITDEPNRILDWFKDLCKDIQQVEMTDQYGVHTIYYIPVNGRKKTLFEFHHKGNRLRCDLRSYWSVLRCRFGLDPTYNEDNIEKVTQVLTEGVLQIKSDSIMSCNYKDGDVLYLFLNGPDKKTLDFDHMEEAYFNFSANK